MATASTLKDFVSSFFLLELLKGFKLTGRHFFQRKITIQFPEERTPLSPLGHDGGSTQAGSTRQEEKDGEKGKPGKAHASQTAGAGYAEGYDRTATAVCRTTDGEQGQPRNKAGECRSQSRSG